MCVIEPVLIGQNAPADPVQILKLKDAFKSGLPEQGFDRLGLSLTDLENGEAIRS